MGSNHDSESPAGDSLSVAEPADASTDDSPSGDATQLINSSGDVIVPPRKLQKPMRRKDEQQPGGRPVLPAWAALALAGGAAAVLAASRLVNKRRQGTASRKGGKVKKSTVFVRQFGGQAATSGVLAGKTLAVSQGCAELMERGKAG